MEESGISIVHLDDESLSAFCNCLEDWSDEMKEAGSLKCDWVHDMENRNLGVRMARNTKGEYVGMIQYFPTEYSPVDGPGHYHIHCCWVHAYRKKGVGDWRGKGIGKSLLAAAEEDIRKRGGEGITAWGLSIPVWMKASWYRKQGFTKVAADGMMALMWKPLTAGAIPPKWRKPSAVLMVPGSGKAVDILSLVGGVCPVTNIGQERIRKLVGDYGDRVNFRRILVRTAEDVQRWGLSDGIFINGKAVPMGPPVSEKKLRHIVERELKRSSRGKQK